MPWSETGRSIAEPVTHSHPQSQITQQYLQFNSGSHPSLSLPSTRHQDSRGQGVFPPSDVLQKLFDTAPFRDEAQIRMLLNAYNLPITAEERAHDVAEEEKERQKEDRFGIAEDLMSLNSGSSSGDEVTPPGTPPSHRGSISGNGIECLLDVFASNDVSNTRKRKSPPLPPHQSVPDLLAEETVAQKDRLITALTARIKALTHSHAQETQSLLDKIDYLTESVKSYDFTLTETLHSLQVAEVELAKGANREEGRYWDSLQKLENEHAQEIIDLGGRYEENEIILLAENETLRERLWTMKWAFDTLESEHQKDQEMIQELERELMEPSADKGEDVEITALKEEVQALKWQHDQGQAQTSLELAALENEIASLASAHSLAMKDISFGEKQDTGLGEAMKEDCFKKKILESQKTEVDHTMMEKCSVVEKELQEMKKKSQALKEQQKCPRNSPLSTLTPEDEQRHRHIAELDRIQKLADQEIDSIRSSWHAEVSLLEERNQKLHNLINPRNENKPPNPNDQIQFAINAKMELVLENEALRSELRNMKTDHTSRVSWLAVQQRRYIELKQEWQWELDRVMEYARLQIKDAMRENCDAEGSMEEWMVERGDVKEHLHITMCEAMANKLSMVQAQRRHRQDVLQWQMDTLAERPDWILLVQEAVSPEVEVLKQTLEEAKSKIKFLQDEAWKDLYEMKCLELEESLLQEEVERARFSDELERLAGEVVFSNVENERCVARIGELEEQVMVLEEIRRGLEMQCEVLKFELMHAEGEIADMSRRADQSEENEEESQSQGRMSELEAEVDQLRNELDAAGGDNRDLAFKIEQLQKEKAEFEDRLRVALSENQTLANSSLWLEENARNAVLELEGVQRRIGEVECLRAQLQDAFDIANRENSEMAVMNEKLRVGLDVAYQENTELAVKVGRLQHLRIEKEGLQSQLEVAVAENNQLSNSIEELKEKSSKMEGQLGVALSENLELGGSINRLEGCKTRLEGNLQSAIDQLQVAQERISQLEDAKAQLEADICVATGERTEFEGMIYELGQKQAELKSNLEVALANNNELEGLLSNAQECQGRLESNVQQAIGELQDAQRRIKELEDEGTRLGDNAKIALRENAELGASVTELKSEKAELEELMRTNASHIKDLKLRFKERVTTIVGQKNAMQSELEAFKEENKALNQQVSAGEEGASKLEGQLAEKDRQIAKYKNDISYMNKEVVNLISNLNANEQKGREFQKEVEELRSYADEWKEMFENVEQEREMLRREISTRDEALQEERRCKMQREQSILEMSEQLRALKDTEQRLSSDIENLMNRIRNQDGENAKSKQTIMVLSEKAHHSKDEIKQLTQQIKELSEMKTAADEKLDFMQERLTNLTNDLAATDAKRSQLRRKLQAAEEARVCLTEENELLKQEKDVLENQRGQQQQQQQQRQQDGGNSDTQNSIDSSPAQVRTPTRIPRAATFSHPQNPVTPPRIGRPTPTPPSASPTPYSGRQIVLKAVQEWGGDGEERSSSPGGAGSRPGSRTGGGFGKRLERRRTYAEGGSGATSSTAAAAAASAAASGSTATAGLHNAGFPQWRGLGPQQRRGREKD